MFIQTSKPYFSCMHTSLCNSSCTRACHRNLGRVDVLFSFLPSWGTPGRAFINSCVLDSLCYACTPNRVPKSWLVTFSLFLPICNNHKRPQGLPLSLRALDFSTSAHAPTRDVFGSCRTAESGQSLSSHLQQYYIYSLGFGRGTCA